MSESSKIYLLRHGQTIWNTTKRLQGHQNSPLTETGRRQAQENGRKLQALLGTTETRMISSPLGRCVETVKIVAGELQYQEKRIEYDNRLKELAYGDWEGRTMSDIEANNSDEFLARAANRWDVPAPGGESYSMVAARLSSWLDDTVMEDQETVVVTSHGCAGRILRGIYSRIPKDHIYSLDEAHDSIYLLEKLAVTRVA